MLKAGDKIPQDLSLLNKSDKEVKLEDYLDSTVVLFFYPKNFTPGCTKEACSFRDISVEVEKLGAKLVGVSADSIDGHKKFVEKFHLNFELLSDADHKLAEAFGVWGEKKLFGKVSMGSKRSTFVISKSGEILKVWPNVKVNNHDQEVLDFLKNLNEHKSSN